MRRGGSIGTLSRSEGLAEGLAERVARVRVRIAAACRRVGRDPASVRLVAVTKGMPAAVVEEALRAGITEFGENYVAELEDKRPAAPQATWHFVGRLQSNKARRVAELADVVETAEPGRAVGVLARVGRDRRRPVDALVQVDFTASRAGVEPASTAGFVDQLAEGEGVRVTGLMTVAPHPSTEPPRHWFARLRRLRDEIAAAHPDVRELSMGMSADLDDAIEEGATMVRVGSAIFGPRR